MTKALAALDAIGSTIPSHGGRLGRLSFSHAEVLARLWQTDPAAVHSLVSGNDWPTYPALLALYEKSRAIRGTSSAAGKLATAAFRNRVGELLVRCLEGDLIIPYQHYTYAKPDFLHLTTTPAIRVHAAYDCLVISEGADAEPIHRRMVSLATESTFFPAYWLVISHRNGLSPIMAGIETLGLNNIGVLQASDRDLDVVHTPRRPPLPDRRIHYQAFMSRLGDVIVARSRRVRGS